MLPQRDRLGVALLQQHDPCAGPLLERLVVLELGRRRLVERVEVAEPERVGPLGADVDEVLDEHAERAAPVADVVLPHDVVADGARACRTSASPMTVVRRCPMCISLATFGAE